jgi:hypothetical protein
MKSRAKVIIILAFFLVGCKGFLLQQTKKNYPYLFSQKIDTTFFEKQDTLFVLSKVDTFTINNETSQTIIYRYYDTFKHSNLPLMQIDTSNVINEDKGEIERLKSEIRTFTIFKTAAISFVSGILILLTILLIVRRR